MESNDIRDIFRTRPELETERLSLVPPARKYAGDMYEYASDERVTEYLTWYPHTSAKQTGKYVSRLEKESRRGLYTEWFIIHRATGKMIGTAGFVLIDENSRRGEIGYAMNPGYWGNGYMTEAVREIIRFGFGELGLIRIEARHDTENPRSGEVMRRAGMTFEGVLRKYLRVKGENRDLAVWSVLR